MSPLPSQSGGSQGGLPSWACLAPPRLPAPCARAGPPPTTRPPAPRRRFPSRRLVGARPWRALGRGTQAQAGGQPRPWPWPWLCSGCGRRCAPSPAGPPPPPWTSTPVSWRRRVPPSPHPRPRPGHLFPQGWALGFPGFWGTWAAGPEGGETRCGCSRGPFPTDISLRGRRGAEVPGPARHTLLGSRTRGAASGAGLRSKVCGPRPRAASNPGLRGRHFSPSTQHPSGGLSLPDPEPGHG